MRKRDNGQASRPRTPQLNLSYLGSSHRVHSHVRDLHATLLHLLGIDHERFTVKYQGLDMRLTGVEKARVLKEVLT